MFKRQQCAVLEQRLREPRRFIQVLAYQKMLGQLHDAGNTTTLAHYLDLLGGAGFVTGLGKYSGQEVRSHASSPKLLALNAALMSAMDGRSPAELAADRDSWGRWVETAVGAWLANSVRGTGIALHYWLDRNREVDFVLSRGQSLTAIEVKSGARRVSLPARRSGHGTARCARTSLAAGRLSNWTCWRHAHLD